MKKLKLTPHQLTEICASMLYPEWENLFDKIKRIYGKKDG